MYYNIHRQLCVRVSGAAVKPSMFLTMCSSRKYIHTLPNRKDYFQTPPPPFKIPFQLQSFLQIFRSKKKKTRKFQSDLWGEFGYFPELYIVSKGLICMLAYQRGQWLIDINSCRSLSFFHHLIYSAKTLFKSNEL